jgi:hypothetical protein
MLLLILVVGFFIWWLLILAYQSISVSPDKSSKKQKWIWILTTAMLFALGIFGSFSQYNLRWSEAFMLGNDYRANLALNPYQSFFSSLKFRKTFSDPEKIKKGYEILKPYFGFTGDSLNLNYERIVTRPATVSRPNILVVVCESFSAYKSSMWEIPQYNAFLQRPV